MIFSRQKDERDTPSSGRTIARVRLVAIAALVVAAVVGGGVWLGSNVDLNSRILSTVDTNAPQAEPEGRTAVAPDDATDDPLTESQGKPQADVQEVSDGEAGAKESDAEESGTEEQAPSTIAALEGHGVSEVRPDPAPSPSQEKPQAQPSQTQPQSGGSGQRQTPETQPTPTTPSDPTPTPAPEPETPQSLSVSVTVDGSAAGVASWSKSVSLDPGATVYDALVAVDGNVNARSTGYGIYVVGIDGLAEKDHGAKSGWMYAVNGNYPNTACSNYVLKDGDSVMWVYVNVDW